MMDAEQGSGAPDLRALAELEQEDVLILDFGGREMALKASDSREVIRPVPLTPVPMGPDHLLGLANVHGQIVCMIAADRIMRLPPCRPEDTPWTRFVVLRHPKMHVGIRVDAVKALYRVNSSDIPEPADVPPTEPSCGRIEIEGRSYDLLNCAGIFH